MERLRRAAAAGAALLLLLTACTTSGSVPTLADVGAAELAGQNGAALDSRCATLPLPATTVLTDCAEAGPGSGTFDIDVQPGAYTLVLLCDGPTGYVLGLGDLPVEPPAADVEVPCAQGPDPAVAHAFTVDEAGQVTVRGSAEGSGYYAAILVGPDHAPS
ncbi:hypothetical protein [Cellulomonas oligotrophica]|uniref:Lipoprotein n=1 Tax=Cellulomonas oligotrophica TaxID=931536 RepID=A0A7Y9JX62_9CELL|nr:hypothetical protein [Cellulomonas oligotrophica]NYD86358.1 hypothetical protein [Cellulomonas oligotrophica]GIG32751.1 hypothetical protein Col01nite_19100 [Cellulomonas oligotrophica]